MYVLQLYALRSYRGVSITVHRLKNRRITNHGYLNFALKLVSVTRNMCVTDDEEYFFKITFHVW